MLEKDAQSLTQMLMSDLKANPLGTIWICLSALSQPANTAKAQQLTVKKKKKKKLTVPDVQTTPNPCFREEGPFSLLCSMTI